MGKKRVHYRRKISIPEGGGRRARGGKGGKSSHSARKWCVRQRGKTNDLEKRKRTRSLIKQVALSKKTESIPFTEREKGWGNV